MSKAAFLKELGEAIAERAAPSAEKKAMRLYHGTIANDPARTIDIPNAFGGVDEIGQGFSYLSPDISSAELGLHLGSVKQANKFAGLTPDMEENLEFNPSAFEDTVGLNHARVVPLDVDMQNPIRLEDASGNWLPTNIYKQLVKQGKIEHNNNDYLFMRQLQGSGDPADKKEAVSMIRKLLEDLGYDGVVYKNRYETGLPSDERWSRLKFSEKRPDAMTDEEFIKLFPEAEDSYIVWDKKKYRSPFGDGTGVGFSEGGVARFADGGFVSRDRQDVEQPDDGWLDYAMTFGRNAGNKATFGLDRHAVAAADYGYDAAMSALGYGGEADYARSLNESREALKQGELDHPAAALAGDVTGYVLPYVVAGPLEAALVAAANTSGIVDKAEKAIPLAWRALGYAEGGEVDIPMPAFAYMRR